MREAEFAYGARKRIRGPHGLSTFLEQYRDASGFELEYGDSTSNPELLADVTMIDATLERPAAAPAVACTPVDGSRDSFTVRIDAIKTVVVADPPASRYLADADSVADESRGYRRLARSDPDAIAVTNLVGLLGRTSGEGTSRRVALDALQAVAAERPRDCTAAVPVLREMLREDDLVDVTVTLRALRAIGEEAPEDVAPAYDEIQPYLRAEDDAVRLEATRCTAAIGQVYPEDLRPAVGQLASIVEGGDPGRRYAVWAMRHVSAESPDAVEPHASTLLGVARDTSLSDTDRLNATATLGRTVQASPSVGVKLVDGIVDLLNGSDQRLHNNAIGLLGDIAKVHTDVVRPFVDDVAPSLTVEDRYTRINASCLLARVAEDFPETVEPWGTEFVELLRDDDPTVRENACWALGHVETDAAASALERLAVNDTDENVRTRAAWALSKIKT